MKQNLEIEASIASMFKKDIPDFSIGDSIRVHLRIVEGQKERIQVFSGIVMTRNGSGLTESFTLFRDAYGCRMERVFLLHSPQIAKIELERKGKTRRSRLYYLRGAKGKAARIEEDMGEATVKEENAAK